MKNNIYVIFILTKPEIGNIILKWGLKILVWYPLLSLSKLITVSLSAIVAHEVF